MPIPTAEEKLKWIKVVPPTQEELDAFIAKMETEMRETAKRFEFEKAAKLRDRIKELRTKEFLFA